VLARSRVWDEWKSDWSRVRTKRLVACK
jgi:hypothetical protein